jgi:hypothetical protein
MLEEAPTSKPPKPTPEDIDLYCLECGYNLRGLSGDPRRCPECGYKNPLGDLEIPAPLIARQLKEMETAPAMCLASLLLASVSGLVLLVCFVEKEAGHIRVNPCIASCPFVLLLCLPAYVGNVRRFQQSCQRKKGWGAALWRYHVYGLGIIGSVLFLAFLGLQIASSRTTFLPPWRVGRYQTPAFIAVWVGVIAVIYFGGRWAHRRAKELMEPLQREVAIDIARQKLRERLRKGGRGPFGK